jgi:CheY-like chemotaxis protein
MRVLIVEDSEDQIEWVRETLAESFQDLELNAITSESDFRAQLPAIAANPPDVVILDAMLRWSRSAREVRPRPEDVQAGNFLSAGLRCKKMLEAHPATSCIPVVVCSVLHRDELPEGVREFLSKESDAESWIDKIRNLTGH